MPVASRQACTTSSEPRSQHGVVVQTCRWYLPIGCSVEHEIEGGDLVDADRRHAQAPRDRVHRHARHPGAAGLPLHLLLRDVQQRDAPRWPAGPADISPRSPAIAASLSASNAKCAGWTKSAVLLSAMAYLSISPNTMSSDPMIAQIPPACGRFAIIVDRLQIARSRSSGSCSDTAGWCRRRPDRRRTRPSGFPPRCRSRRPARG